MCDIVNSPCKICGADLPLHLGDFDTDPSEVSCFCAVHLPEKDVRVFTLTEEETYENLPYLPKGWKMGIRYLTDNARKNRDMNFPNIGADWTEEDR